MLTQTKNLAIALASLFSGANFPRGRVVSPVQQRMREKEQADAPRRRELAREIKAWNANVLRRNQEFARTGLNKHLRA
jgi:hypothetical protein